MEKFKFYAFVDYENREVIGVSVRFHPYIVSGLKEKGYTKSGLYKFQFSWDSKNMKPKLEKFSYNEDSVLIFMYSRNKPAIREIFKAFGKHFTKLLGQVELNGLINNDKIRYVSFTINSLKNSNISAAALNEVLLIGLNSQFDYLDNTVNIDHLLEDFDD